MGGGRVGGNTAAGGNTLQGANSFPNTNRPTEMIHLAAAVIRALLPRRRDNWRRELIRMGSGIEDEVRFFLRRGSAQIV